MQQLEVFHGYPKTNAEVLKHIFYVLKKRSNASLESRIKEYNQSPLPDKTASPSVLAASRWYFDHVILNHIPEHNNILPIPPHAVRAESLSPSILRMYFKSPLFRKSFEDSSLLHSSSSHAFTLTNLVGWYYEDTESSTDVSGTDSPAELAASLNRDFTSWYYLYQSELCPSSPNTHLTKKPLPTTSVDPAATKKLPSNPFFTTSTFYQEFKDILNNARPLLSFPRFAPHTEVELSVLYDYYLELFVDYITFVYIDHAQLTKGLKDDLYSIRLNEREKKRKAKNSSPSSDSTSRSHTPITLLQKAFLWFVNRWVSVLTSSDLTKAHFTVPYLPAYAVKEIAKWSMTTTPSSNHTEYPPRFIGKLALKYYDWHRKQKLSLALALKHFSF